MRNIQYIVVFILLALVGSYCNKSDGDSDPTPPSPSNFNLSSALAGTASLQATNYNISRNPTIKLSFSAPIDRNTVASNIQLKDNSSATVSTNISYERSDSVIVLKPASALSGISRYSLSISNQLKSVAGGRLNRSSNDGLITAIDSSRKFPINRDDSLHSHVQRQTLKNFWDFAHTDSKLARERNKTGQTLTYGGSGCGIMAIVV